MACGCTDNRKLNDNKQLNDSRQLDNNKMLKLDSIQNLSIDEIINLYRDGYRLEDIEYNTDIVPINESSMKNLSYGTECSGSPQLDKSWTTTNLDDYIPFVMRTAYAQKFTPASRCLSSVKLRIRKVSADGDATVTICSDSGGYPSFPSGGLGDFTRSRDELSYSFAEVDFPLNILLSNINPVWIVITSLYDPNETDTTVWIDIDSIYTDSGGNFASKIGNSSWTHVVGKPWFKTYRLIYSPPIVGTITVTSPNGEEHWLQNSIYDITWNYSNITGNVKIELFKAGILNSTISSSTVINDGAHSWTVPSDQIAGADYTIKITSLSDPSVTDSSNTYFEIIAQIASTITVTSPNGNETWMQNSSHNITWTYLNITGNVKIELFKAGILNSIISSSTMVSAGTYSWPIPLGQTVGADYTIKITSLINPSILDSSDANFRINASGSSTITVTSPIGGETWMQNSAHNITWSYSNLTGNVKIELFKGGVVNSTLSSSIAINTNLYGWIIPPSQTAGTDYTIKITSNSNPSITDSSNANFEISTSAGIICQSITTPTATPSTIAEGNSTTLSATVTPSSQASQEFSVQFMDGITQIGNPVTTISHVATKSWSPIVGTHNISAKVGSPIECTSPGTVQVVVNPSTPSEAGGAGVLVLIAAVAAAAIMMSKK